MDPEPYYKNIQEFIEDLSDHPVELCHNNEKKYNKGVWKHFNEFKQGIEEIFSIDFHHVAVYYEDFEGIPKKISNEPEYFESVKTVDPLRLYLRVDFDDSKVKKKLPQDQQVNIPIRTTPWSCPRCQARNNPENLKCKVCSLARRN